MINNADQFPPAVGIRKEMLVTGPICRYASDLSLLFKVFAGENYETVSKNFETHVRNLDNLLESLFLVIFILSLFFKGRLEEAKILLYKRHAGKSFNFGFVL